MGGKKEEVTKTEAAPWKEAQPYYLDLYKKAQEAFNLTNNKPYTGDLYAGPNSTQQKAVQDIIALGPQLSAGAKPMQQLALDQIGGKYLSPDSNPWIKDVVGAALKPVQAGFDKNRLSIDDRAISEGAYGGARQDLQQLEALKGFNETSGDISSKIYADNYARERGIQQNSGSLLNTSNLLALAGPTAAAGAGAVKQGWDQKELDALLAQYQMKQQAPWSGTSELANILGAGGFGTQTNTKPGANPLLGMLQGLMGGATTGAGLATGIGGVAAGAGLGAFAPWMLPFAALGGLAGGLS